MPSPFQGLVAGLKVKIILHTRLQGTSENWKKKKKTWLTDRVESSSNMFLNLKRKVSIKKSSNLLPMNLKSQLIWKSSTFGLKSIRDYVIYLEGQFSPIVAHPLKKHLNL